MAEQIITLGIGATPANLIPFMTTGLEIGAVVAIAMPDNRAIFMRRDRRAIFKERDKRAIFKGRE